MNNNNVLMLSFKLFNASRKKSRLIKIIIFVIFFLVLFFVNMLFSSFEKTISSADFMSPLFIATKDKGSVSLQKNIPLRKNCINNNVKRSLEKHLTDRFEIKEGFVFTTYFTEILSQKRNNVVVEFIDLSSINTKELKKNEENINKNRAIPVYVNMAFTQLFDIKEDYLVYISDFFGNIVPMRMRASSYILSGNINDKARCYVDINFIKQFLSIPEDLSLPLFIYYKDNVDIFTPEYLILKHKVVEAAKEIEASIKPFYSVDVNTNNIFHFYMKVLFVVIAVVILILLYAMSVSYYISFNARKRDFAIFRAFGLTDRKLYLLIFLENFYTCFIAFITSILLNLIIGIAVKDFVTGSFILSFDFTYPGIIMLVIILLFTSFISVLKAYHHIIKSSSLSSLMERK